MTFGKCLHTSQKTDYSWFQWSHNLSSSANFRSNILLVLNISISKCYRRMVKWLAEHHASQGMNLISDGAIITFRLAPPVGQNVKSDISQSTGQTVLTLAEHIHAPKRMNLVNLGDPVTFHLMLPSGQNVEFNISESTGQIAKKFGKQIHADHRMNTVNVTTWTFL